MSLAVEYVKRETVNVRVDLDRFEVDIQEQSPEKVILQWGDDDEYPERRDIGQLCYLDRLTGKKYAHVNLLSVCNIRKAAVKKILAAATYMSTEHMGYARNFIDFIDLEFEESCDLISEDDLKKAYVAYTRYLQHRLYLSKIKGAKKT
jgi:hypothetical protein